MYHSQYSVYNIYVNMYVHGTTFTCVHACKESYKLINLWEKGNKMRMGMKGINAKWLVNWHWVYAWNWKVELVSVFLCMPKSWWTTVSSLVQIVGHPSFHFINFINRKNSHIKILSLLVYWNKLEPKLIRINWVIKYQIHVPKKKVDGLP